MVMGLVDSFIITTFADLLNGMGILQLKERPSGLEKKIF